MKGKVMDIEKISKMEYAGGGYFREKKAVGHSADIIHAPEMKRMLLEEIGLLAEDLTEAEDAVDRLMTACDEKDKEIKRLEGEIESLHQDMAGEHI